MLGKATYLPRVWLGSQFSPMLLPTQIRPLSAHVKLTENCQAKCISCNYWESRWEDSINTERAVELINEIGAADIRTLRFTGGEPLLRRDFFEILRKADTSGFKNITVQTNGLLLKKLHKQITDSPITNVAVSVDGLKETNDLIRGIRGYFDLAIEGIRLLRGKKAVLSVTLNGLSARELDKLADIAEGVGANVEYNILSQSLFFLKNADVASMWPGPREADEIARFARERLARPSYEVDYISKYYRREPLSEPPCILGYLQVFVLSNGDVLTGCYPLKPVGNILRDKLETVLASDAYHLQAEAMVRRECPGCTCGVESSLAMQHSIQGALFELSRLKSRPTHATRLNARADTPGAPASSGRDQRLSTHEGAEAHAAAADSSGEPAVGGAPAARQASSSK